jgi:hypothetical protein
MALTEEAKTMFAIGGLIATLPDADRDFVVKQADELRQRATSDERMTLVVALIGAELAAGVLVPMTRVPA